MAADVHSKERLPMADPGVLKGIKVTLVCCGSRILPTQKLFTNLKAYCGEFTTV
jgi:hypothetical protein